MAQALLHVLYNAIYICIHCTRSIGKSIDPHLTEQENLLTLEAVHSRESNAMFVYLYRSTSNIIPSISCE